MSIRRTTALILLFWTGQAPALPIESNSVAQELDAAFRALTEPDAHLVQLDPAWGRSSSDARAASMFRKRQALKGKEDQLEWTRKQRKRGEPVSGWPREKWNALSRHERTKFLRLHRLGLAKAGVSLPQRASGPGMRATSRTREDARMVPIDSGVATGNRIATEHAAAVKPPTTSSEVRTRPTLHLLDLFGERHSPSRVAPTSRPSHSGEVNLDLSL